MSPEASGPRIALVHALAESVAPAREAFRRRWPEAICFDLLDTSLAVDLAHAGRLDEAMFERFRQLSDYALGAIGTGGRTAGILFTCSAFGPAIDEVKRRLPIPVLRTNEAAFEAAITAGDRLGLVVSFGPSADALARELAAMADARGRRVSVELAVADGALEALKRGNADLHDDCVLRAVERLGDVDAILLGQFSLARARTRIAANRSAPVITSPDSAVDALRRLVPAPLF